MARTYYPDRLIQVVHLDSSASPLQTLDYQYDVFGRRIGKSNAPAVGPAYLEDYVYDGHHLALKFEAGQLANRYLHGPLIDQILADEQVDSLASPGDVLWPLADNLGTVRDLASHDPVTGVTTIANHIAYDAFGGVTGESNSAVDHIFGYTGREWDAAADLQYNRARWYDPATGRWVNQDAVGFSAKDANLYRYVGNGPAMFTDPSGLRESWSDYWHYLNNPGAMDRDVQIAQSASFGVAAGAGSAAVVLVAAPAAANAGAMYLWGAGYSATTSVTVASGGVTAGLGATGVYGGYNLAVSSLNAYNDGDWNQLAYNGGMMVGGAFGIPGSRPCLANSFPGTSTSGAPPLWNVVRTIRYEWDMGYSPAGSSPPGLIILACNRTYSRERRRSARIGAGYRC